MVNILKSVQYPCHQGEQIKATLKFHLILGRMLVRIWEKRTCTISWEECKLLTVIMETGGGVLNKIKIEPPCEAVQPLCLAIWVFFNAKCQPILCHGSRLLWKVLTKVTGLDRHGSMADF